jgi:ketosteroid isomerase-like protein
MEIARDALAIRGLCDRYAFAVDAGDTTALMSLFTSDGHLVSNYGGGEWHFHGREELAQVVVGAKGIAPTTMHLVGNHRAEIDGDKATGLTYCIANHLRDDSNLVQMVRYLDRYTRDSDGEWLIADRRVDILWTETHPVDSEPTSN